MYIQPALIVVMIAIVLFELAYVLLASKRGWFTWATLNTKLTGSYFMSSRVLTLLRVIIFLYAFSIWIYTIVYQVCEDEVNDDD